MPAVRLGTPLRVFWRIHRAFMRLSGGRFGRTGTLPALLLTTRGRKTGESRDVTLNFMPDCGALVVIASYGGEDRDPAWWQNLKANPEGGVLHDGKRTMVRAREADGAERQALWDRFVAADPSYLEYQQRTERRLAVVVLEPAR
ncbi:MAG: nitroreductase/quinone reductase family protein [Candidatus Limnocylindria bacterium]